MRLLCQRTGEVKGRAELRKSVKKQIKTVGAWEKSEGSKCVVC